MKRSFISGLMGLTLLAGLGAQGQGGITFTNYQPPYNPVLWPEWSPSGMQGVRSTDGVQLTLWYGEGVLSADELLSTSPLSWNLIAESSGYYGYYYGQAILPDWNPGDTYTFQVRATGNTVFGPINDGVWRSVLWYENENIQFFGGNPPNPPGSSTNSIGFVIGIPEPSFLALLTLGISSLLLTRRLGET